MGTQPAGQETALRPRSDEVEALVGYVVTVTVATVELPIAVVVTVVTDADDDPVLEITI